MPTGQETRHFVGMHGPAKQVALSAVAAEQLLDYPTIRVVQGKALQARTAKDSFVVVLASPRPLAAFSGTGDVVGLSGGAGLGPCPAQQGREACAGQGNTARLAGGTVAVAGSGNITGTGNNVVLGDHSVSTVSGNGNTLFTGNQALSTVTGNGNVVQVGNRSTVGVSGTADQVVAGTQSNVLVSGGSDIVTAQGGRPSTTPARPTTSTPATARP